MNIALEILAKAILPTHLKSAEIRAEIAAAIRRRSLFTARCAERAFLDPLQTVCADFAGGKINHATAREKLRAVLDDLGYDPLAGGWPDDPRNDGLPLANELEDLTSTRRLDLILETQREKATSLGMLKSETDRTRRMYPAWRLVRVKAPMKEGTGRDWAERWLDAADWVNWEGVATEGFVALKGSPIWQALADGAGGYEDVFTDSPPVPPFAFNSGMAWNSVSRAECEALGLDPDDAEAVDASLSPGERELAEAAKRHGDGFMEEMIAELKAEGLSWTS